MNTLINRKRLFFALIILTVLAIYLDDKCINNFHGVQNIAAEGYGLPVKNELFDDAPIIVSNKKYKFDIYPNFNYSISGLILTNDKFSLLSGIKEYEDFIPRTISIMFADNLSVGAYKQVSFQSTLLSKTFVAPRACPFRCGQVQEITLVVADKDAYNKITSIVPGDQVTIEGLAGVTKVFDHGKTIGEIRSSSNCDVLFIQRAKDIHMLRRASHMFFYCFRLTVGVICIVVLLLILSYRYGWD